MTTLTSEITEVSLKSITEEEQRQQQQQEDEEQQIKLLGLCSNKNETVPISLYDNQRQEQQIDVDKLTVVHDTKLYMFRVRLDCKDEDAALCYLPTRVKKVIEFYHMEIPLRYRHKGIGDLLVKKALNWAKETNTLVIPTCSFIQQYLLRSNNNNNKNTKNDDDDKRWKDVIVYSEEEGMELVKRKETSYY